MLKGCLDLLKALVLTILEEANTREERLVCFYINVIPYFASLRKIKPGKDTAQQLLSVSHQVVQRRIYFGTEKSTARKNEII